jgi:hypothetical protein
METKKITYNSDIKKNFDVSKVFKALDINTEDYLNLGSYNLKNNKLTVLKYKN